MPASPAQLLLAPPSAALPLAHSIVRSSGAMVGILRRTEARVASESRLAVDEPPPRSPCVVGLFVVPFPVVAGLQLLCAPVFVSPAIDYYAHHPVQQQQQQQQMHVLQLVGAGAGGGIGVGRDSGSDGSANGQPNRRRRNGFNQGRRRMGGRPRRADREDSVRRTVYVSDIDQHVTEQKLAEVFSNCGQVVDCRICGDPNSVLRFAFIEFADDVGARAALTLGGTVLGYYPVRVLPSKTSILPVNPKFLPQTEDEKEMVSRTVYCTNIDKNVGEDAVKNFFEELCGEVARLRLLGDYVHSTCITFVEFVQAEGAILALNCSGMVLGSLPVRVSPSKTPVRPRSSRVTPH